jgi:large subunit ribosomal protein L22
MIAHSKLKFSRVSPTKVRQVIDLIRGKDVPSSQAILTQVNKGCHDKVLKVLNSAVANAKQKGLVEDQLFISKIFADQGPTWKRYRAASFGRATPILKRTTHLTVELDLITKTK